MAIIKHFKLVVKRNFSLLGSNRIMTGLEKHVNFEYYGNGTIGYLIYPKRVPLI